MSTTKTLDQLSINTSLSTTDLFLVQKEGIDQQTTFNTIQEAIAIETLERVPAIKVTNATFADQASAVAWSAISGKPTTWAWAAITGTPSTLTGYGITDALRNNANSTLVGNLGITGILSVSSSSNVGASITTNGISVETANVGVTNTNIGVYGYARSGTSANYGLKARADGHVAASAYGIFAYASANGTGNSVNSYGIYAQAEQVAAGSGVCWGGYFQGKDGIRVCDAVTTHDGVVLLGRAGGSTSYNAILTPTTLSADRTLTLPNLTGTLTTLENAQVWTGSQTFRGSNAVKVEAASTQDAIILTGRTGGTDSFAVSITPAVLSASRTLTLPNVTGIIATIDNAQTWSASQTFRPAATQDAIVIAGRAGGTDSFAASLTPAVLSANRTLTLPDKTDTLATLTDVSDSVESYDLIVDSNAALALWAAETGGAYERVFVRKGTWTLASGGINLTAAGTKVIQGEIEAILSFTDAVKPLYYASPISAANYNQYKISDIKVVAGYSGSSTHNTFDYCVNISNVTVEATASSTGAIVVFNRCTYLNNCYVTAQANRGTGGYSTCYYLTNCSCINTSLTDTYSSDGFSNCYYITTCFANVCSAGESNAIGYSGCDYIRDSTAYVYTSGVSFDGSATGFASCDYLVNCSSSGDSDSNRWITGYLSCNHLISCKATHTSEIGEAGLEVSVIGFSSCTSLTSCTSTVSANTGTSIASLIVRGYSSCTLITDCGAACTVTLGGSLIGGAVIIGFNSCTNIKGCTSYAGTSAHATIYAFANCSRMLLNYAIASIYTYTSCTVDLAGTLPIADTAAGGWNA